MTVGCTVKKDVLSVLTLERRGDAHVVPKLIGRLADSDLRVRMAATDALRQVASKLNGRQRCFKSGV